MGRPGDTGPYALGNIMCILNSENNLLAFGSNDRSKVEAAKTHCPNGHPYAGANLRIRPNGHRACRACHRAASRERYWMLAGLIRLRRAERRRQKKGGPA
jgi:hypothetical protein